eukprot:COSAG01_NODE_4023_length_5426_cov_7.423503_5_plen_159_part_00
MAAKGEKKDYFSVPEDLRDQLYYSDATKWLEPGGVDRTYQGGTPHDAESPWGTKPGKFELRPIPNGVRTIRRRTTLRWDAHGQLMLPIAEKRTVQVQTSGGAPLDERWLCALPLGIESDVIYYTQLHVCSVGRLVYNPLRSLWVAPEMMKAPAQCSPM